MRISKRSIGSISSLPSLVRTGGLLSSPAHAHTPMPSGPSLWGQSCEAKVLPAMIALGNSPSDPTGWKREKQHDTLPEKLPATPMSLWQGLEQTTLWLVLFGIIEAKIEFGLGRWLCEWTAYWTPDTHTEARHNQSHTAVIPALIPGLTDQNGKFQVQWETLPQKKF